MVQQQEKAGIKGRLGTLTLECESLFAREVIELNSKLMVLMEAELMEIHHLREHMSAEVEEECRGLMEAKQDKRNVREGGVRRCLTAWP